MLGASPPSYCRRPDASVVQDFDAAYARVLRGWARRTHVASSARESRAAVSAGVRSAMATRGQSSDAKSPRTIPKQDGIPAGIAERRERFRDQSPFGVSDADCLMQARRRGEAPTLRGLHGTEGVRAVESLRRAHAVAVARDTQPLADPTHGPHRTNHHDKRRSCAITPDNEAPRSAVSHRRART